MRSQPIRRSFGFDFFRRFAKRQGFGLGKDIREQQIVMTSQRRERMSKGNKIARNQPGALMNQLIERMLSVGARFAPVNRAGLIIDVLAIQCDVLAVACRRRSF